ncbi:MAG TPA: hypothetical protein VNM37_18845, partial [Candidatus Dormibacteraeota bacterium]|nr:hypothetical protein [Candidatus Dormibacteraeota bacterium]
MGLLDNLNLGNLSPYQTGLLGSLGPNDLASLLQAYYQPQRPPIPDAPQIPIDPSGSTPMGSAPPNPYGNPSALMPSFTSTIAAQEQPQGQPNGGSWLRPGSFLDKLLSTPQMAANAAPAQQQPKESGAEPNAVWGGPQQTANVPTPLPRPAPGVNLGL